MKKIIVFFILFLIFSISNIVAQNVEVVGDFYLTGKLGIGTNAPQQRIDARGVNENSGARLLLGNSDLTHKLILFPGRSGNPNPFILWKDGDPLRFITDGGGFSEKFRIASDGLITVQNRIRNVTDPEDEQDAATKAYVDHMLISFGLTFGNEGIQKLLDVGICPLEIISAGVDKDSLIGMIYQEGFIFYLDDLDTIPGIKGMCAALTDQSSGTEWGCHGVDLPNVPNVTSVPPSGPGSEFFDGLTNTDSIVINGCIVGTDVAKLCYDLDINGIDNWFLPSIDELEEMYLTIGPGATGSNQNIGGFEDSPDSEYWSSTEFSDIIAWIFIFENSGIPPPKGKNNLYRVRAARAF